MSHAARLGLAPEASAAADALGWRLLRRDRRLTIRSVTAD
jgi:hypothetical protein